MAPLFRRKKEEYIEESADDYLTIEETLVSKKIKKNDALASIRVFVLDEFEDIREILDIIRGGKTICLIDIHLLRNKDPDELKRAVDKLKKTSEAVGGELVGFHDSWILSTPSFIKVHKGAS